MIRASNWGGSVSGPTAAKQTATINLIAVQRVPFALLLEHKLHGFGMFSFLHIRLQESINQKSCASVQQAQVRASNSLYVERNGLLVDQMLMRSKKVGVEKTNDDLSHFQYLFFSSLMFNHYSTVPLVVVQGTFISLKRNFH